MTFDSKSSLTTRLTGEKKEVIVTDFFNKGQSSEKAEHVQLRTTWQFGLIYNMKQNKLLSSVQT